MKAKERALCPGSYYAFDLKKRQKLFPKSTGPNLCEQLLDSGVDSRGVGATDHLDPLAVLEEEESRHSGDLVVGGNLAELVNVDLVELDAGVLLAQLLDGGGDGLAGTAPLGEEVDEDGLARAGNLGLEVLLTIKQSLLVDAKMRGKEMKTYVVISTTLPPILKEEREKCGTGVEEKARGA